MATAALLPGFGIAALGLLEERGEDAGEGDYRRNAEEDDARGAPERHIAGGAGLLRDVGKRQRAADDREEGEGDGEDVERASHGLSLGYVVEINGEHNYAAADRRLKSPPSGSYGLGDASWGVSAGTLYQRPRRLQAILPGRA
jgi:hypothetical protein